MMGARGPPGPPGPPVSTYTPLKIEPMDGSYLTWLISYAHHLNLCLLSLNRDLRDTPDTLVSPESLDKV